MSEENENQATPSQTPNPQNNPLENAQGILNTITTLQKEKPAIFYGALAGIFLVLWFIMSGSGSGDVQVKVNVSAGQTVTLTNPNGGKSLIDEQPGNFSLNAEDEKSFVCYAEAGTTATVREETMIPTMGGQALPFVKVEITGGDCAGKSGWTAKTNIKN